MLGNSKFEQVKAELSIGRKIDPMLLTPKFKAEKLRAGEAQI